MRYIAALIGLILLVSFSSIANADTSGTDDFFVDYTLPIYDGSWQYSELRNTSVTQTNGNIAYVSGVNSSGKRNHIAFDIEFMADAQVMGIITLSNGENLTFSAKAYTDWLIQNNIQFSLGQTSKIDGYTNIGIGYGTPSVHCDLCTKNTDNSSGVALLFGDPELWESYLGSDLIPNNIRGIVSPVQTGYYITAVYVTHVSGGEYRLKVSEYTPKEISNAMYLTVHGPARTSYPGIESIIGYLGNIGDLIWSMIGMTMFLVGFVLWVIYPTNLLLIVVSAETVIVLLALTSSRDIFQAMAKFARYNEQAFYAVAGLASTIIGILSGIGSFIYNTLHALWPLG